MAYGDTIEFPGKVTCTFGVTDENIPVNSLVCLDGSLMVRRAIGLTDRCLGVTIDEVMGGSTVNVLMRGFADVPLSAQCVRDVRRIGSDSHYMQSMGKGWGLGIVADGSKAEIRHNSYPSAVGQVIGVNTDRGTCRVLF